MNTYIVPATFIYDHINRDLLSAETIQGSKGRCLVVSLTDDEYGELLSDAEFHAEGGGGFGPELNYLMRSAAATVRSLIKQEATK